jgi:hypothetical protein
MARSTKKLELSILSGSIDIFSRKFYIIFRSWFRRPHVVGRSEGGIQRNPRIPGSSYGYSANFTSGPTTDFLLVY